VGQGPAEVVIDAGTADKQHLHVGDSARIATAGPARSFRVTGITTFGSVDSLGTATIAVFDLHAAQGLFDKTGRVDSILVEARHGVPAARVRRNLAAALPQAKVQTAAEQDRYTLDGLKGFIAIIKGVLLGFGGVALLVGAFTIFNSLSIMVAQRSREFGLLRLAGASRRQVLRTVVAEALAMGAAASAVGVAAGFGLAKGINALFKALGLDLPETGTVFATRTIVVSLLVGVLVTLVAGLLCGGRLQRAPGPPDAAGRAHRGPGGAAAGGRPVPRRQGVQQARLHRAADQRRQPAAGDLRRAAGTGRDRQPLRAGQHARAGHLRAHPRDRDAARRGHDAPPGAAHGAPREHHHRTLGSSMGIAVGIGLAAIVVAVFGHLGFTFALPIGGLAVLVVVGIAAGTVAAMLPARRAARMDVLGALAYE
jgi:ABC-type lipoprotein release transport system permease subunit